MKILITLALLVLSNQAFAIDCYKNIPHTAGYSAIVPGLNYLKAVKCEFKSFKQANCPGHWSPIPSNLYSWYNFDTSTSPPALINSLPKPGAGCCLKIYFTPSTFIQGFSGTNCDALANSGAQKSATRFYDSAQVKSEVNKKK
jgi:hypothetical protein